MPSYTSIEALKLNGGSLKPVANFINNTTPVSSGTYTPSDILSTTGDSMFDIMNYIDPSTHKLYSNIIPLTSTSPKAPANATKIWDLYTGTHMCFYVNQDDSNFYAISLNFYRADNSRITGRSITIWNQYEGLTDGKVVFAETHNNTIDMQIIRNKHEFCIEVTCEAIYMICDEETDTPIEKEVPLSELKDVEDFFLTVRDFIEKNS